MSNLNDILGIGPAIATGLAKIGVTTTKQLSDADVATLSQVRGISEARAAEFIAVAKMLSASPEDTNTGPAKAAKEATAKPTEESKPAKDKTRSKASAKGKKKSKAAEGKNSKKDKEKKAKKSTSGKKTKKAKKAKKKK